MRKRTVRQRVLSLPNGNVIISLPNHLRSRQRHNSRRDDGQLPVCRPRAVELEVAPECVEALRIGLGAGGAEAVLQVEGRNRLVIQRGFDADWCPAQVTEWDTVGERVAAPNKIGVLAGRTL